VQEFFGCYEILAFGLACDESGHATFHAIHNGAINLNSAGTRRAAPEQVRGFPFRPAALGGIVAI
jgi:hypothetical protein